jgi:hypothetical protein
LGFHLTQLELYRFELPLSNPSGTLEVLGPLGFQVVNGLGGFAYFRLGVLDLSL